MEDLAMLLNAERLSRYPAPSTGGISLTIKLYKFLAIIMVAYRNAK